MQLVGTCYVGIWYVAGCTSALVLTAAAVAAEVVRGGGIGRDGRAIRPLLSH